MAASVLAQARRDPGDSRYSPTTVSMQALRAGAEALKVKAGQMFQPIRVAVCGRKRRTAVF